MVLSKYNFIPKPAFLSVINVTNIVGRLLYP
jgi:hypothetical protein